jgi:hypothetical protein
MSTRDDKKDLNMAGAQVPADTYRSQAERVAEAEDADATKADEPGTGLRVASVDEEPERRVSDQPPERNINPRK